MAERGDGVSAVVERNNFYILSGGPGAGKTTVLDALRARGFQCVEETGRKIIREQKAIGGTIHHNGDRAAYRDLMLSRGIDDFNRVAERNAPVFFDRGIPELTGYSQFVGSDTPPAVEEAVARYRYNQTVFLFPPWQEIYANDSERKQDFREAIETCAAAADAYERTGYRIVEMPKAPVAARVEFILCHMGYAVS
jgi:predicted ATPase